MSDQASAAAFATDGSLAVGAAAAVDGHSALAGVRIRTEPHACFGCGDLNKTGLQMELFLVENGCWTELTVPERFQGWEGVVHGGVISTILDEVMSWSLIERDSWGVTARMTVEFKRPLMVGQRIRAEGHVVEDRRRIATTAAHITDAETGEELAAAQGTFVMANAEKKRQLQERYGNLAERRREAEREVAARGST